MRSVATSSALRENSTPLPVIISGVPLLSFVSVRYTDFGRRKNESFAVSGSYPEL